MKTLKPLVLAAAVIAAYLPMSVGAFGFGATKQDHPWGPYGPYGAYPPAGQAAPGIPAQGQMSPGMSQGRPPAPPVFGPPPGARNIKGMWGSGPGMSWGSRNRQDRAVPPQADPDRWSITKGWNYVSPYENAPPWVSPYAAPPADAAPR